MGTGSFIWYELMSTDPDAATRFYGAVVGWTVPPSPQYRPRHSCCLMAGTIA
jgi:uncharacterized protein